MLIHAEAFALAFAGCAATNLDNLLLVLASARRAGAKTAVAVFFGTLAVVIVLAMLLSLGVDLVMPRFIAWIGLVPLSMGLYELFPRAAAEQAPAGPVRSAALSLLVPLAANSLDTLVVQTILFADLSTGYHLAALAGGFGAAGLLAAAAIVILSRQGRAERWMSVAARLRPWLLIAVGALIFMDTGFDTQ